MRTVIIRSILFVAVASVLAGCTTTRTATFPDKEYDFIYKNSIKGLCTDPGLIVYEADKAKGTINVMVGGLFGGQIINVTVAGSNVTAFTQGVSPYPDRMISAITTQVMTGKAEKSTGKKKKRKVVVIEEGDEEDSGTKTDSSSGGAVKPAETTAPVERKAGEPAPADGEKKGSLF